MCLTRKICCLCLKEDNSVMNLTNVFQDNQNILNFCFPDLVEDKLEIPIYMCYLCHSSLISFCNFKTTCVKSWKFYINFVKSVLHRINGENSENQNESMPCVARVKEEAKEEVQSCQNEPKFEEIIIKNEVEDGDQLLNNYEKEDYDDNPLDGYNQENKNETGEKAALPTYEPNIFIDIKSDQFKDVSAMEQNGVMNSQSKEQDKSDKTKKPKRRETDLSQPFTCELCYKEFTYKWQLNRHIKYHSDEKTFGCTFCTRKFKYKYHLKEHLRIHADERPYACTFCPRSFAQKGNLNCHLRTHSSEKARRSSFLRKLLERS